MRGHLLGVLGGGLLALGCGFVAGQLSERATQLDREAREWSEVLVVVDGTLVANPSALTPRELARSQIFPREPRFVGLGCEDGASRVGESVGELVEQCREVVRAGASLSL